MTCAWSVTIAALSWATSACWSSTCCLEIESCLLSCFVAGEVALRLAEQRLVLGQLPLGLRQRRLVGARIDLGEEVAGLDRLALGEPDLLQIAGDLGLDGHGLERRHRSQGVDGQRHVAERHRAHAHRLRRLPGTAGVLPFVGRGGDVLKLLPGEDRRGRQRHDERDPDDEAAPARPRRLPRSPAPRRARRRA